MASPNQRKSRFFGRKLGGNIAINNNNNNTNMNQQSQQALSHALNDGDTKNDLHKKLKTEDINDTVVNSPRSKIINTTVANNNNVVATKKMVGTKMCSTAPRARKTTPKANANQSDSTVKVEEKLPPTNQEPRMLTRLGKRRQEQQNNTASPAPCDSKLIKADVTSPVNPFPTAMPPLAPIARKSLPRASNYQPTSAIVATTAASVPVSSGRPDIVLNFDSNQQSQSTPVQQQPQQTTVNEQKNPTAQSNATSTGSSVSNSSSLAAAADREEVAPQPAPPEWKTVLKNIRMMRFTTGNAPVDMHGPAVWSSEHNFSDDDATMKNCRFQALVSLILSAQAHDEKVGEAMDNLGGLLITPDRILSMTLTELKAKIRCVGLCNDKASRLKKVAEIVLNEYDGDIPSTFNGLMALPGVGVKMALIALNVCWGKVEGIAVDTHVQRISMRLGWARGPTVDKIQMQLQDWVPRDEWKTLNHLLVGFGQTICSAKKPKCNECLNARMGLCPFQMSELAKAIDF